MINEDNVNEEFSQTEQDAIAQSDVQGEKMDVPNHSTVLGKFKDVDALVKAYESLQAEFTRRSQRLKDLERRAEQIAEEQEGADSGAEKLRKNAQRRKETAKAFDDFVAQTESSATISIDSEERQNTQNRAPVYEVNSETSTEFAMGKEVDSIENTAETDLMRNRSAVAEETGAVDVVKYGIADSSDELFKLANANENVRLKIIGEYLRSIGRSGAPLTVGGGTVATPPAKPASIGDAGVMALRYFKNTAQK